MKKIALFSAIAAASFGLRAEIVALDDSVLGDMTAQAGLTIDLETVWSVGEFAYQDGGFLLLKNMRMGGNSNEATNAMLDNIRLEIDIAGANTGPTGDATLHYGFSDFKDIAAVLEDLGNNDNNLKAVSRGAKGRANAGNSRDGLGGARIDNEVDYRDGDLKIHLSATDPFQKAGGFALVQAGQGNFGSPGNGNGNGNGNGGGGGNGIGVGLQYSLLKSVYTQAIDFEFSIGQVALASSAYASAGRLGQELVQKTDHATGLDADAGGATTTTLLSDLSIKGYLGPADIHIENLGNGFGSDGSGLGGLAGTGKADSKIHWDTFFNITDLDVYLDIAGVQITDMKIHNERGDLTSLNQVQARNPQGALRFDSSGNPIMVNTASFGFAHAKRDIYAVKDTVLAVGSPANVGGSQNPAHFVDGIAIDTRFKGDVDIGALSFGDSVTSIGSIYITDIESTKNWVISAH